MAYQLSAGVDLFFIIVTAIVPFGSSIFAGFFVLYGGFHMNMSISKDKAKIRSFYSSMLLIAYIFSIITSTFGLVFVLVDKTSETPVYSGLGLFLITSIIRTKLQLTRS